MEADKFKKCKLCGELRQLGNSHVIPAAFYKPYQEEKKAAILASNTRGTFPKKSRNGVYDQTILCKDCEKLFQAFDDYAAKIFLNETDRHFRAVKTRSGVEGFQADDVDQNLIMQFLISVLWRASVSSQEFFSRVNLGPFEASAAKVIQDSNDPIPPCFGACLSRWEDDSLVGHHMLMDPIREKWEGVNAYRLYLGQFVAYIRVDQQPFRAPFDKISLLRHPQLFVTSRSFTSSKDRLALIHTAVESIRNDKFRRG